MNKKDPNLFHDEYLKVDALSSSGMRYLERSPRHYLYSKQAVWEPTKAQELGTMVHMAVLEPKRFLSTYVAEPKFDKRTNLGKAAYESFVQENKGKLVVPMDSFIAVEGILEALEGSRTVGSLLKGGIAECSYFSEMDGVPVKCRADYVNITNGILVDVKTTQDASATEFARSCKNYDYARQMCFYKDIIEKVEEAQIVKCVIIAIESKPPYGIACYEIHPYDLDHARSNYKSLIEIYKKCMTSGLWPTYVDELNKIDL